ncbi:MAG: very short patch repair endonuclease [Acidobacteria bacterium]|nr:very short patch repair endonuclease [Acidobacteriota bacterium]
MSRVRGKDTRLETVVRSALHRRGLRFRKHVKELPGCPDIVFPRARIVVFIDGDFWHGYEYEKWKSKLSPFWHKRIGDNIERDSRTCARLLETGWRVIRIWQHDVRERFDVMVEDIVAAVRNGESSRFDVHMGVPQEIEQRFGTPATRRVDRVRSDSPDH